MTQLVWERDPEALPEETDVLGKSGQVVVGGIRKSNNSVNRWRWEIVGFPGLSIRRDDRSGWVSTEDEAKAKVQEMWSGWLDLAGLLPLLKEAVETVEGLSQQQAMPDDWYVPSLTKLKTAVG